MEFSSNYHSVFRQDFADVIAAAPKPNHLDGRSRVPIVQPRVIGKENPVVRAWERSRQAQFATALFFTVLADQVCYTYFGAQYPRFEELTRYPKLTGDCPGGCSGHHHPDLILRSIGQGSYAPDWKVTSWVWGALAEAAPVMEHEVRSFCTNSMPELNANDFWLRCAAEIPRERLNPVSV